MTLAHGARSFSGIVGEGQLNKEGITMEDQSILRIKEGDEFKLK